MHKRDEAVAIADLDVLARIYRRIAEAALDNTLTRRCEGKRPALFPTRAACG
jgi:hypothetical protein